MAKPYSVGFKTTDKRGDTVDFEFIEEKSLQVAINHGDAVIISKAELQKLLIFLIKVNAVI